MRNMKELTVWECQYCKQLFKTENRHDCKKDPDKKNCFSCKWLNGWKEPEIIDYIDVGIGTIEVSEINMICKNPEEEKCMVDYDLESIKQINYNMQCEGYCKGEYYEDVYVEEPYMF